jgi:Tol biopolymer transport system component
MRNFLGEHVVNVAWSPDGEHVAYHERLAGDPIYVADRNGANSRLILGSPAGTHQHYPIWAVDGQLWRLRDGKVTEIWRGSETALLEPAAVSPDGDSVVLLLRRDDGWRLHVLSADGAQLEVLSEGVDARGAAAWSPDGRWIVTGGSAAGVRGLFKIPVEGGAPERIADGEALNPVWSPDGSLIVYAGAQVNVVSPLLAVSPDGDPVELPEIEVFRAGERMRFLPDGSGLVYMRGFGPSQDFWLLDLATMESRRLTRLDPTATMRTFDITPDGQRIVFDRLSEDSDVVLIELGGLTTKLQEPPQNE